MRELSKLAARKVATIHKPGRYGDGGGLWLQVSQVGERVTKAWLFRFMLNGRARQMGLGSIETFSLAEARERARVARQMLADGRDPIEARLAERDALRRDEAERITFKDATTKYLAVHERGWRNAKHRAQWRSTLTTYAFPTLGKRPVKAIDAALINGALAEIWRKTPETASRVKQRVERIVQWVKDGMPLPAPSKTKRVAHHAALPYAEAPQFMEELRVKEGISARALEFTILTAARTGEAIGATWDEFDLPKKIWTVPGDRMKGGKDHKVPLSDRAVEILTAMPRERGSKFVFIGAAAGKPLSNMAMLEMLRGMRPGLTVHGFRSTFRDWAAERTSYPNHVVEMALAHVIGDKVEAAYRRGDLFEKRQRLMSDWARYCATADVGVADNVTPLRGGAATR